ncbi:MAG TPA: efflux RND transporter periplasmic adaptor subunit [Thermoanaerobaculia bacterium]|nr:efflux RND transporter periplasmic adaptor subunit [Thermoanaerobaculia bacterium]
MAILSRLAFCALLPVLSGCYDDPLAGGARDGASIPAVEAVQARFGRTPLEQRLSGVVKARNQVAIRSELSARVAEVYARSGDAVERGQPLVRLDDASLRDQLRQSEASARLAEAAARSARARITELEAQVRRSRVLVEENLISELELETQEAQLEAAHAGAEQAAAGVEQAVAAVEERRTARGKTLVRAPVTGRVGQRDVEVGSLVDSGTVLFVIGDLGELRVEVSLTQSMLEFVREGQPVLVSAPALGEDAVPATLSRISPFLAAGTFSTVGEIDISNPEGLLRPGMFLTVDVLYGESAPAAQVPASALWEDPRSGVEGTFVVAGAAAAPEGAAGSDGTAGASPDAGVGGELAGAERTVSFRAVDVLTEGRGSAAVDGLEEGEWVVTVGQHLLRVGEPMVARVHATTWERVLALEELQREDVLRDFLAKQREAARTLGARPPTKDEMLDGGRRGSGASASATPGASGR